MPLKIAAKVDKVDREYYEDRDQADDRTDRTSNTSARSPTGQKSAFLSGAIALLVPIDWPEPFGLVMIEAMACGTPVIAFNRGSVPEVVDDGVTGFIVEDEKSAIGAVYRLPELSRAKVRERFEQRFTARRMAQDYLARLSQPDGSGGAAPEACGEGESVWRIRICSVDSRRPVDRPRRRPVNLLLFLLGLAGFPA